jgi:glycosyltransferase involved in cell wall biosynthesis
MKRKLMFVVNVDWFFYSHRMPIALAALAEGYEVHIACRDTGYRAELESRGLFFHPLALERGRSNIFISIVSFVEIFNLIRSIRPNLLHLVTIKPVLLGGLAARLTGIQSVVISIPGLGFIFSARGFLALVQRIIITLIYQFILGKKSLKVIFQNTHDRDTLCGFARISPLKIIMIRGSGVNLKEYGVMPFPDGIPLVILAARLLRSKGVMEFVQAAKILLSKEGCQVRFCLLGEIDPDNPDSLTRADIERLRKEATVEVWGYHSDMNKALAQARVVVLPSYYGEGLPKILIEAAACGRPVVTTDHPGCRDAIQPGVSGLLVPVQNSEALAAAIIKLLEDPVLCLEMGLAGRNLAEREFDLAHVIERHLNIYRELDDATK